MPTGVPQKRRISWLRLMLLPSSQPSPLKLKPFSCGFEKMTYLDHVHSVRNPVESVDTKRLTSWIQFPMRIWRKILVFISKYRCANFNFSSNPILRQNLSKTILKKTQRATAFCNFASLSRAAGLTRGAQQAKM